MAHDAITNWFAAAGWTPFPFQHEVWDAYGRGESGLIYSPTGTGKTYAVWFAALANWLRENEPGAVVKKRKDASPLRVLWITPLRALAADTLQSLIAPLESLGIPWTVETRTGDTSAAMRSRQRTLLPSTLVTTPESLSLLLTRENAPDLFTDLECVVVDEWHELLGSKRGVQVELALARLRRFRPGLRTWGLSATVGNLEESLRTLVGRYDLETGEIPEGRLIRGDFSKKLVIDSILPDDITRFPWAGHHGLTLLPQVLRGIEANRTSLIFTNTRSQTERWYQEILAARPEWAGEIALHHSSIDAATRDWVERNLRTGALRCVVCTSSLDLGVDFPTVDAVFQIGSPKGAARLMQRAGRSGHQPGAESRVICVPAQALELLEISAAREAITRQGLEARVPHRKPLDVLVQHAVTVAIGGGFDSESLYREVRTTQAYHDLTRDEWEWVLDFVTRGGDALKSYEQYSRVRLVNGRYEAADKLLTQAHRMSIGTILDDASLVVQYINGDKLGSLEESFVSRLSPGDHFTFGGKVLEFVRLRDLKVWVRKAKSRADKGAVPRWYGGGLPISEQLTGMMREKLNRAREGIYDDLEMQRLRPLLDLQAKLSRIPTPDELLIESVKTREGHHLFFYPFAGRLVHEGLAALLAYRIARDMPVTFTYAINDYGFELLSPDVQAITPETDVRALFSTDDLLDDIHHSLNMSEMSKRQFREVARVSGLVTSRFPGGQKTVKQLQASSSLIYDVLEKYDRDNLLLAQAEREVLQRQLEQSRLFMALNRISAGEFTLQPVKRPTPFCFPLLVDRLRQTVSSETLEDRIKKMQMSYEW